MNHADIKRVMADYLEGDLDLTDRAGFDAHLEQCEPCTNDVEEMRQTIQLLQLMPEPEQPPMVAANVMRRIRAGETEATFWQRIARGVSGALEPSFVLPASAVAVAALVTLVVRDPNMLDRWRVDDVAPADDFVAQSFGSSTRAGLGPQTSSAASAESFASLEVRDDRLLSARPSTNTFNASGSGAGLARLSDGLVNMSEIRESRQRATTPEQAMAARGSAPSFSPSRNYSPSAGAAAGLRPASAPPATRLFADRGYRDREAQTRSAGGRARGVRVAGSASMGRMAETNNGLDSSGRDPRDVWLARGLEDPAGLAAFLGSKNLAEQELWVARLADRAHSQGILDELVQRLRQSGNVSAAVLSDDFLAQINDGRGLDAWPLPQGESTGSNAAPVLER